MVLMEWNLKLIFSQIASRQKILLKEQKHLWKKENQTLIEPLKKAS